MTMDQGHQETEKILKKLEKKISDVYSEAADELSSTITEYFAEFQDEDMKQYNLWKAGEITKQQYTQWRLTQIARGERYQDLRDKVANRYTEANQTAIAYVNDMTPSIYSLNRNYAAYTIEKAGGDIGFTLWDESTVRRLLKDNPDLMPYYPADKAIRRGIDLAYGKQQITNAVQSAILQGRSITGIADDLQTRIQDTNRTSAIRAARTATTNAENAGRQDEYTEAKEMGIELQKCWLATLDDRTREAHQDADGQTVEIDEPFTVDGEPLMFPGDDTMGASGWNVYNCRCSMITKIKNVSTDSERWTGDHQKVSNMTYKEWAEWRSA